MNTMKIVVEAKNIKKVYGTKGNVHTALDDITLKVHEGEFVSVMGPSGAGKSTLLHCISTIDRPTSGEIYIDGIRITNLDEEQLANFRREKLGFIFQDYNLLDTLTVKENIILPLALARVDLHELEERVNQVAKTFGLDTILEKYPYQISGGQKQRTAAARAMITKPTLLLADEPTGALDSKSATDLLESLKVLNKVERATILLVTH